MERLEHVVEEARTHDPIRVAVVNAAQTVTLESVREAASLGLAQPHLIGHPEAIERAMPEGEWPGAQPPIEPADDDETCAAAAVRLVREGHADAVMKGYVHTDTLMHALLHETHGLRCPGRRVSHVFVMELETYPKLLCITDAAINISPDLEAKAEIVQNAVSVARLLGVDPAKVAALSAVETVSPHIASTVDAACLTVMAQRRQITGAIVDGPLAFDNAISAQAAREKHIDSPVAGDVDVLLVPDLVSGNVLAKDLEYLAKAQAAGIVVGLTAPVILTSRSDPAPARLAAIALAVLMHHRGTAIERAEDREGTSAIHSAPQPDQALRPPRG
jgi:phosphotransacetylase